MDLIIKIKPYNQILIITHFHAFVHSGLVMIFQEHVCTRKVIWFIENDVSWIVLNSIWIEPPKWTFYNSWLWQLSLHRACWSSLEKPRKNTIVPLSSRTEGQLCFWESELFTKYFEDHDVKAIHRLERETAFSFWGRILTFLLKMRRYAINQNHLISALLSYP